MQSVNEIIKQLSNWEELQKLDPHNISLYQVFLSANYWQCGQEIIKTEQAYNLKWREARENVESDKQADRLASVTKEYEDYQKARYAEKTLIETIRSLKKMLLILIEESHNQM